MSIKQAIEALLHVQDCTYIDDNGRTALMNIYDPEHVETALAALRAMPAEPPDWSEVGRLMDAVSAAYAGRYMVGTTNWAAFICRQMKQATPHTAPKVVSSNLPVVSTAVLSDAERYRWLRDRVTVSHQQRATATGVEYPTTFTLKTSVGSSENIDDAIDAALAGEAKP